MKSPLSHQGVDNIIGLLHGALTPLPYVGRRLWHLAQPLSRHSASVAYLKQRWILLAFMK